MPQVIVMRNDIEGAIRSFRKQVDLDGILAEIRARLRGDPKPSVRRKAKARIALKRRKRVAMRRQDRIQEAGRMPVRVLRPIQRPRMPLEGVKSGLQGVQTGVFPKVNGLVRGKAS